jgi:radical SAM superfamily enzyme YgiQ (UPF0313 family)
LGYLAAYLRRQGFQVRLILGITPEQLLEELAEFRPQVVGVSSMTPTFSQAVAICRTVKRYSDAVTVLGGVHVTALKGEILDPHPEVDFVVYGEGEETLGELCQALAQGEQDFSGIAGLVFRRTDGTTHINPPRELIKDVDSLPFPARDLVDMSRLGSHRYIDSGRVSATITSSRGCPFNCAFCSSHITMGKRYRIRSVANVLAEVDEVVQRFGVSHLAFEDDTFTLKPERVQEICEGLIARRYDLTWFCLSRVETMTEELARLMRRAGCRLVSFGIETGSQEILEKIHKKISLIQAQKAIEACYRAGLRTQGTFILGFPFDTRRTLRETLLFAQKLSPTVAIFFCLIPFPGTEMFKYLPESLRPQKPEDWQDFVATINNQGYLSLIPGVSAAELARLTELWHLRFYLRPRQLYRMLRTLHNWEDFHSYLHSGWGLALKLAQVLGQRG